MLSYPESSLRAGDGVNPNLNHTTNDGMVMISHMKCRFLFPKKGLCLMAVINNTHTHIHTRARTSETNKQEY